MTTGPASRNGVAARLAAALLTGAGLLALAGCDQRAAPHPAYEAPAAAPPTPLAGAPEDAPTAAPPPATAATLPDSAGSGPAPTLAPAPTPAPAEEAGPAQSADQGLVAMAPILNPEDGGPTPPRHADGYVARPAPTVARRSVRHHPARRPAAPVAPRPAAASHHAPAPVRAVARAPAKPPVARPAAPAHASAPPVAGAAARHERRATRTELRRTQKAKAATSTTTGETADARTEALRSALSAAVARGAVLTVPKAAADQAVEATLVVPADFYDSLKREAGRQAMADAAASANLDATLSGDGYAIIPGGPQAQPLRAGQPTTFHWTVTAPTGAKGPLRADVTAELLGGGAQTLALGAVDQASAPGGAPKWWGAALLALVVALGLGWLARSRSADARIAASRRRGRRPDGTINGQRPLDLRPGEDPPG